MEKKTLYERYGKERLTNNTALNKCQQCKTCALQNDGTVWTNHYQKGSCMMYPYPRFKPDEVMMNKTKCPFYKEVKQK